MNTKLMFSSQYDAWETPIDFFNKLNDEFKFDIDVCAAPETAKCDIYFTKERDCLTIDWREYGQSHFDCSPTCFMNPPYGREIYKFIKKAYEESLKGCEVICLLPSRTDTKWYHDFIWDNENHRPKKGVEIRNIKGRLTFGSDA